MNIFCDIGFVFTTVICYPLGWIPARCYDLVKNYGLAIILFTLVTRLLLLPL